MRVGIAGVVALGILSFFIPRPVAADPAGSLVGDWTDGRNTFAIRTAKVPGDSHATLAVSDLAGDWIENGTTPSQKTLGLHLGTMRGEKDRYEGNASTHTFLIFWVEGGELHVRSDGLNKFTEKMETLSTVVFKKKK